MLSCKETAERIAADARRRASLRDRLAVWLHLAMCRYCRAYERSLRALGTATRRLYEEAAADAGRVEDTLEAVRRAIPPSPPEHPL